MLKTDETSIATRYDALPDPIFIGGYMRSGTSFIMKLLMGHPHTTGFKTDADLLGPIVNTWLPELGSNDPYTGIKSVLKGDESRIRRLVRSNWFFVYEFAGVPISIKRVVEKTPDSQALFARTCEVFPAASYVVVFREPLGSVRSALAHSLLFYPQESRNIDKVIKRVVTDWTCSMERTRTAAQQLGERLLLVNFDEFLSDVATHTRDLFAWCAIEPSDDAVARAIKHAGSPGDERAFWQRILKWPEDEFAQRYSTVLTDVQRDRVKVQTQELFDEVNALRSQALRSAKRPGLSGSATTTTTASPGS